MELIIITGPPASGKSMIANMFLEKLKPKPVLCSGCTLAGAKQILTKKPEIIILDELNSFDLETIKYFKNNADIIKEINIKISSFMFRLHIGRCYKGNKY